MKPNRCARLWAGLALALLGAEVSAAGLPTLHLAGDSTVKNGRGDGAGGLWGWGDRLAPHLDTNKVRLRNHALGGRSSRTYLTEGRWEAVRRELQPGDFVLIQFGHNDGGELFRGSRPRASLKGIGPETREGIVESTGSNEVVHTYGWYLRRYIDDARQRGAVPVIMTPVPRNIWSRGRVVRADRDHAAWAAAVAREAGVPLVDLNERVARAYEQLGASNVAERLFTAADHTHTTDAGARLNARIVAEGLRALPGMSLAGLIHDPATAAPAAAPDSPRPQPAPRDPASRE